MDGPAADVAAFVLAGGKSTRMGSDKAFVMLEGRTLLTRALELARTVSDNVRIVGSAEKFAAFAPVVEDVFRECGPLGGIHAALRASSAELNLMLAVVEGLDQKSRGRRVAVGYASRCYYAFAHDFRDTDGQ